MLYQGTRETQIRKIIFHNTEYQKVINLIKKKQRKRKIRKLKFIIFDKFKTKKTYGRN
jgi:hypothetical protein